VSIDPLSDAKIVDSWHRNAAPWTAAVRDDRIESRVLATNQAIVDAVLARSARSVLDVGCGEGWLVRALAARGIIAMGTDVVPELIDQARRAGGGEFRVASYEAIAAGALDRRFDLVVANFSLIGRESVDALVARTPTLLNPSGALIIQTLHPVVAAGDLSYEEGWREGSWTGFGSEFSDPAPWYFRTIEGWVRLIVGSGLRLTGIREPLHPATKRPASVIFVAERP
jgi:2-polyprenyl-3-methyl-5-hydroxy-6-metoxy-1,4-benzoquinol methylase